MIFALCCSSEKNRAIIMKGVSDICSPRTTLGMYRSRVHTLHPFYTIEHVRGKKINKRDDLC